MKNIVIWIVVAVLLLAGAITLVVVMEKKPAPAQPPAKQPAAKQPAATTTWQSVPLDLDSAFPDTAAPDQSVFGIQNLYNNTNIPGIDSPLPTS